MACSASRRALTVLALAAALGAGAAAAQPRALTPGSTGAARAAVQPPSRAEPSVDADLLGRLFAAQGFTAGTDLKVLIGVVGSGGAVRWYDLAGTSDDREDWWPASTVKIFAAVAALERTRALGFSPEVQVTYQYEERPIRMALSTIVRRAITHSDNRAFDRLVELVGFDEINGSFLVPAHGLGHTVLLRAYSGRIIDPETHHGVNRHSPRITLREDDHRQTLPERQGRGTYDCPDQGNCTTLRELAEAMRRVMLHDELPPAERFALGPPELTVLRDALEAERERGDNLPDAVRAGYGEGVELRAFHKPGYANRWVSDVMLIQRVDTGQRWIVAAANRPGREALDEALRHVGAVLAGGALPAPARSFR